MPVQPFDRIEWALRERVKELTCLYGIARITQQPGMSLDEILHAIVQLLPPAWQFPASACATIIVDSKRYTTDECRELPHRQRVDLVIKDVRRGYVEVAYRRDVRYFGEAAFLEEEQHLIEMVARDVAMVIERHEAEDAKAKLEEQLRHADRLATIGQLAAGVAHEINEPLANILGYAQLAMKTRLSKQTSDDMSKIVRNCLHAREVIQKLLTFARQMPPEKSQVNLNRIVDDGLYFLESRCAKAGIVVERVLDESIPEISADQSQLHQVLINLVVNAVQAMPQGGTLAIATNADETGVCLRIQDTGVGMTEEVQKKIFTPFFTTKDVNQGTGLGLAVVHGIVASHGGSIRVKSAPGEGSCFEVRLPLIGASRGTK